MRLQSTLSTRAESTESGTDAEYVVLGGGHVGASVARSIRASGHTVTFVDETHDPDDLPGVRGDPTVVVAMPRDRRSLLVAGLVRANFGVADVRVLVRTPERCDLVADAGHEPICATTELSDAVVADLEVLREPA